jgi:hypothetical protein
MFSVDKGRLRRDGQPFVAIGANYHPSAAGCQVWTDWEPDAMRADFSAMADNGLNTVRMFLFWRDAQPTPGTVSPRTLEHLAAAVAAAGEAGLGCVVSLFTIWMNGQLLDLPWRAARNIWRDPLLLDAEIRLARTVAGALRGQPALLAYDLGDELWHIDPVAAAALPRPEIAAWQRRLADAIREEAPGTLVLQANDATGVFGSSGYGSDNSADLDLIGTHAYPSWAPGSIESTLSYKATHLVPFQVRVSAAYGTPLVDEVGAYGVAERTAARYLRAAAASALGNGAAGLLAWSWKDIASRLEPYHQRPMERFTGLRRLDDSPRPTLEALRKAAAAGLAPMADLPPARTALFLPERVRGGGGSYLDAQGSMIATFYAYLLLKRAHLGFDLVADEPVGRDLIICPSVTQLTLRDMEHLGRDVMSGATLYLSMGDHLHGFPGSELTGVEIEDFCGPEGKEALLWGGDRWPLDWPANGARPTRLGLAGARCLAVYPDGTPALTAHRYGQGTVLFCNAPVEALLDRRGSLARTDVHRFYQRLASTAGIRPEVACTSPEVEVITGVGPEGDALLLVNHAAEPVRAEVARSNGSAGWRHTVELDGKDWMLLPDSASQGTSR